MNKIAYRKSKDTVTETKAVEESQCCISINDQTKREDGKEMSNN